jgi:hypothetical protein
MRQKCCIRCLDKEIIEGNIRKCYCMQRMHWQSKELMPLSKEFR